MLNQHIPADIDGPTYLKTVIAVAHSDGSVPDKEREFIDMQAQLLSLDPTEYWDNPEDNLGFLNDANMSRQTCMTIIRDCIVLGHIDGNFDENERAKINDIASMLGVKTSDVEAVEEWLKELWAVMEKGSRLFQGE